MGPSSVGELRSLFNDDLDFPQRFEEFPIDPLQGDGLKVGGGRSKAEGMSMAMVKSDSDMSRGGY